MTLTATPTSLPVWSGRQVRPFIVQGGVTIYPSAITGIYANYGDPAGGKLYNWGDYSYMVLAGPATGGDLPNGDVVVGDNYKRMTVDCSGAVIRQQTVIGACDQSVVGQLVYATDENTFTLTPTRNVGPIGWVSEWYESTTCDITVFTPEEYLIYENAL